MTLLTQYTDETTTMMMLFYLCSLMLVLIPIHAYRRRARRKAGALAGAILAASFYYAACATAEEIHPAQTESHKPEVIRQEVHYQTPNVFVIRQDGEKQAFKHALDDGRPVVMSFIFTSCAAICPMLGHTLMKTQSKLTERHQNTHLVSISIDPENDTPAVLSEYAKKFSAGQNWDFYTGSRNENIDLQKAFNVFRGDKMNHASVILIRYKPERPWIRLEGFITSDMIMDELDKASRGEPIS